MIRICYISDPAFLGGAEHYLSELALALDRTHFAPSLVMRAGGDDALNAWADDLRARGVGVTRVAMNLPQHPADALALLRVLDGLAPHVVHVNMPGPYNGQNALLVPLARLCGARVVVTEHLPMVPRTPRRGALKSLAYRWLDLAITMTNSNAESLRVVQGVDARRIRVVANGVGEARPAAGRDSVRREVGAGDADVLVWYIGNLLEHKGLHLLIEALSKCGTHAWRLGVIGDGPDRALAERAAVGHGVADRVVFMGRRPASFVRTALPAGDLLALPSRWEGLPYVILEAMAAGLPVVASAVFGIPEVVVDGDTGRLVPPGDVAALSRALDELVSNGSLRARWGTAGRARFQAMFTRERQVARMSALYRELVMGSVEP